MKGMNAQTGKFIPPLFKGGGGGVAPAIPQAILEKMKTHTPFRQSVWKACAQIPKGQVRTYGWIAKRIGKPNAARAVGAALGANPFAPTIPCHRVVRTDGTLGGYSAPGGLKAKVALLRKEHALK